MRKIMMLVAACMLSIAASVAQTTESLSIADFEITAGETKSVDIKLATDMAYVAFQFDLILPEGLSVALNNRGRLDVELDKDMGDDHTLTTQKVSGTENLYRFLCYSMTNAPFFETSGPIVHLTIQADADAPAGTATGTITDIQFIEWSEAAIEHRFADATFTITCKSMLPENVTVSVGDHGLATYCPKYGIDFTNETEIAAYKASVDGNIVKLTRVYTVAAGEGVLLRSLNGGAVEKELPIAVDATPNEDNAFVGVLEYTIKANKEGDATIFVLAEKNGSVDFFTAKEMHIDAGKAYLPIKNYDATRSITLVFDDTTDITEVAPKASSDTDDAVYTIGGVRVKTPGKGLYIKNGKKVVVR